jgi:hypothetical protein
MATHDYVIANQSGSAFRSDLNNALSAIVSQNSSATAPATTFSYQYWVDTSVTPALLKQRNAANDAWITLAEIGGQTLAADGTAAKPGLSFAADTNTGIKRNADDEIGIVTGGTEAITIKSDGDVGINKTSPDEKFHVAGRILFEQSGTGLNDGIRFTNGADTVGHIGVDENNALRINGGGDADQINLQTDAGDRMIITDTSITTTVAITQPSDQRLKENIAAFAYNLDSFKLLQPKVFDWKNPEAHGKVSRQLGFIAQEVETVDSCWVDEYKVNSESADAQYLDADRIAKTSKLGSTDAMYVSVIQQLLAKVEALETKVAALEAAN